MLIKNDELSNIVCLRLAYMLLWYVVSNNKNITTAYIKAVKFRFSI